MRFLIDQNLPTALLAVLGDIGHEAIHIKRLGLATAPDHELWRKAGELGAVMVSKDSDFLAFASRDRAGPALVRLRVGNRGNRELYDIVRRSWPGVVARLNEGETLIEVRA
ncbi:DUF5615 family PIN-like protein [uncultured Brevundimonas sp.]|uniref:DUF5615 family PIN-like protein n=1 Tax=uncultured Brevundimonas sp. TaxID=213418 RepID=UPI00260721C1|nr:DUF5615 family PIN-like protein [uncultured Brevundimonas sp.]